MRRLVPIAIILSLFIFACEKPQDNEIPQNTDTAYQAVIGYYAPLIMDAFQECHDKALELKTATDYFESNRNEESLEALRTSLFNFRLAWINVTPFRFGPGEGPTEDTDMTDEINSFPIDVDAIESNIISSAEPSRYDEQGLAALDYLLHRDYALALFTDGSNDAGEFAYLEEVVVRITDKISELNSAWQGSYGSSFAANTGSFAGSGMSLLINNYIRDYEVLKREKVALPLGILTLGIPLPDHVEAPYAGYSAALAELHLETSITWFYGGNENTPQEGSIYKAIQATGAFHGENTPLEEEIVNRFNLAHVEIQNLSDPLIDQIQNEPETVETVYYSLQSVVPVIKADMPSSLGISITFNDNDGD